MGSCGAVSAPACVCCRLAKPGAAAEAWRLLALAVLEAAELGLAFAYTVPGVSEPQINQAWCPWEAAVVDVCAGMLQSQLPGCLML